MGKRSSFERVERDFYPTPLPAALPLLDHLSAGTKFAEPCAGDGALVRHLESHGHVCTLASDIEPQIDGPERVDVFNVSDFGNSDCVITNPPWNRKVLHPMIHHFVQCEIPAWLLFDADWPHTKQSADLMGYCSDIVPVGRVKWIPDSKYTGKDNAAWYRFDVAANVTIFHPRQIRT